MKKQFRKTSAMLCAITVMASSMSFSGFVANADGETVTSDYTLTIPATLAVENSGWNSIGNLTATGTLAQGKKLNVTATSENSWNLTSGENTVAYKLCGETEKTKTYADAAATTSLDISKESLEQTSGFSVPIGIVVEDYSEKPAGDYSDTVTFTASVEDAAPATPYATANIGDVVTFGDYNWYIIGKNDNGVTLLMKDNLENKKYSDSDLDTWENCSLRTYLNGDFYNSFSDEDKAKIVKTSNTNTNPDYSINDENNTEDYIYLLSIDEANALDNSIRAKGSRWWLRSHGQYKVLAAFVYEGGSVDTIGLYKDRQYGVRPALNLEF